MRHRALHPLASRSLHWLLCWVMLLPLAQTLALGHGLSHVSAHKSTSGHEISAPVSERCDLCLVAAVAGGAALAGASSPAPCPEAGHCQLARGHASGTLKPRAAAYQSRAPPTA